MKSLIAPALVGMIAISAHAEQSACAVKAAEANLTASVRESFIAQCERDRIACRKVKQKTHKETKGRVMNAEEEECLDRAMSRNLLRSIEEQLRRRPQ
jgi:hypothetical protein